MAEFEQKKERLKNDVNKLCTATMTLFAPFKNGNVTFKSDNDKKQAVHINSSERKYPLEETIRDSFSQYLGTSNIPEIIIHQGGPVQELLKKSGALALASDNDIYIRDDSFKIGSTVTDMLLLHELTHVIQYRRKDKLGSKEEIAIAEEEAKKAEQLIFSDPCYYVEINGKMFLINNEIKRKAIEHAISLLNKSVELAIIMEDLPLMCAIQEKLKRGYL